LLRFDDWLVLLFEGVTDARNDFRIQRELDIPVTVADGGGGPMTVICTRCGCKRDGYAR
jgi:hypothetical protein